VIPHAQQSHCVVAHLVPSCVLHGCGALLVSLPFLFFSAKPSSWTSPSGPSDECGETQEVELETRMAGQKEFDRPEKGSENLQLQVYP
jgi:hypothetical protein